MNKVSVVLNGASGSLKNRPIESVTEEIRRRFGEAGAEVEIEVAAGPAIVDALKRRR